MQFYHIQAQTFDSFRYESSATKNFILFICLLLAPKTSQKEKHFKKLCRLFFLHVWMVLFRQSTPLGVTHFWVVEFPAVNLFIVLFARALEVSFDLQIKITHMNRTTFCYGLLPIFFPRLLKQFQHGKYICLLLIHTMFLCSADFRCCCCSNERTNGKNHLFCRPYRALITTHIALLRISTWVNIQKHDTSFRKIRV